MTASISLGRRKSNGANVFGDDAGVVDAHGAREEEW
jgi:hypothetical protein